MPFFGWKLLAFLCGMAGMLMSGTIYAFTVYSNSLKATFRYTQSQVDILFAVGNIGICAGFPAGFLYRKFGVTAVCFISFVVPTAGYVLMWSTTLLQDFYHSHFPLTCLYFFIAGHGSIYIYIAALTSTMVNFPKNRRGIVVGIMDAMFGGSAGIFSSIYGSLFTNGYVSNDEEHQNMSGFFLLIAGGFAAVSFLAILFLREYPFSAGVTEVVVYPDVQSLTREAYEYSQEEEQIYVIPNDDDLVPVVGAAPKLKLVRGSSSLSGGLPSATDEDYDICGLPLLKRWDFHFLIWPFLFASVAGLTIMQNITVVLKDLEYEWATTLCTTLIGVLSGLSRLTVGVTSDLLLNKVPRVNILFVCVLGFFVVLVFSVVFAQYFEVLVLLCIMTGVSYGALWCLTPTMMSEMFGLKYFGVNWGFTMLASAVLALIAQYSFGAIYDAYDSRGLCLASASAVQCFRWSFMGLAGLTLCAIICLFGLLEVRSSSK